MTTLSTLIIEFAEKIAQAQTMFEQRFITNAGDQLNPKSNEEIYTQESALVKHFEPEFARQLKTLGVTFGKLKEISDECGGINDILTSELLRHLGPRDKRHDFAVHETLAMHCWTILNDLIQIDALDEVTKEAIRQLRKG